MNGTCAKCGRCVLGKENAAQAEKGFQGRRTDGSRGASWAGLMEA